MTVRKCETMPIATAEHIVLVRQAVRKQSVALGFNLVDQTKFVTAASELARNTLDHGGGGSVHLEIVETDRRTGIRLTFEDQGPGIANLDLALTDGYTSGNGMGLGLTGARRLSNEFEIWSEPGKGTRVTIVRWK
jgi:serine/threonine-protein kinase RsbT